MSNGEFKLNYTEFNPTLEKYRQFHRRRTAPEIVNKKTLYIARGAIREAARTSPASIKESIGREVFSLKRTKSGRTRRVLKNSTNPGNEAVPVGALIINYLRGKRGEKGLEGQAMKEAILHLVMRRTSAIAFLAAGWIPAVKKLSPLVSNKRGIPAEDSEAKKISKTYGSAKPATAGMAVSIARIINDSLSKFSTTGKGAVYNKAARALQKAISNESASMKEDIENNMRKAAKSCGIKTN